MLEFWFPLGCVKPTCGSSEGCGHVADRLNSDRKIIEAGISQPIKSGRHGRNVDRHVHVQCSIS